MSVTTERNGRPLTSMKDIALLALASRLVPLILLNVLSTFIRAFDTSHEIQTNLSGSSVTLRWDALHFASIAKSGYEYEQQLAFQPGYLGAMKIFGEGVRLFWSFGRGEVGLLVGDIVQGGIIVATISYVGATLMLFKLTEQLTTRSFALTTTLFYLFPPTPAVLSSPYTEPLYAFLAFSGYYFIVKKRFVLASLLLAGATSVRATGVFNSLLLAWAIVFDSSPNIRWEIRRLAARCLVAFLPCLITVAPFLGFQVWAFWLFCTPSATRPWCHERLPFVYSFVQGQYWNVGFLKYWTFAQIPNLMIAFPVLYISISGSVTLLTRISHTKTNHPLLLPFHLHHILMTLLLIFSSHTQIALRVISGDPVFWWNVARMGFEGDKSDDKKMKAEGRLWIWWCVIWGAVSIVLWAGHYPPA